MRARHRGVRPQAVGRHELPALTHAKPLLILWDIDGTLLQRAAVEHAAALYEALRSVHGIDPEAVRGVPAAGRTDAAIARDFLLGSGVAEDRVDARWVEVMEAACAAYARLVPESLADRVTPGIPETLAELSSTCRFSLVTGNFERIARLKLKAAGLVEWFASGQGGFGSDSEARGDLPAVARRRAGDWPRERTVVIGDTPHDIACARADGIAVIAVTTGPFGRDELEGADAVVDHPRDLPAALAATVA